MAIQLTSPPGPRSGGPGTFVAGLAAALRKSGVDTVLLAPSERRGAAKQRGSQVRFAWEQFVELRRIRPDVVHTHDHPFLLASAVAYRLFSHNAARLVFTSHLDPVVPLALWKRVVMGWMFARCAAVTVMAHDSIQKLEMMSSPPPSDDSVCVIPGAATVHVRSRGDAKVIEYARTIGHKEGPVLLQVSNFHYPSKVAGSLRLLEAFVLIRERFPSARLILLGQGPYVRDVQEARDRLGLTASVTIPGTFIDDLSLPASLADVQCHISMQDACPISILEAMHAGRPVVASRVGGIPELIDDGITGLLVDDDPQHIAAAVMTLLDDPVRARAIGLRARAVARAQFTWTRVADAFLAVYDGDAGHVTAASVAGGLQRC